MPLDHLAIIMDGNRRLAISNGMPAYEGHVRGADNLWKVIRNVNKHKLKYLTVFVFSTENWKRSKNEISFLMNLLSKFLDDTIEKINTNDFSIRFIGDLTPFKKKIVEKIRFIQKSTSNNKGLTITLALNYGGRFDIINATNKILNNNSEIKTINEKIFKIFTLNKGIPDPDLLIRTGGEMRLSNFLLWDLAYTELMFLPEMWPEFNSPSLNKCLSNYKKRIRKYGGDN